MLTASSLELVRKNMEKNTILKNTYIRIGLRYRALRPARYSFTKKPGRKSKGMSVLKIKESKCTKSPTK
jgi:hypothetical protein